MTPSAPALPVSTLDRLEIQELVTRYNHAVDRDDVESWVACFTAEGAFEGVAGRYEGAGELRAFVTALGSAPEWAAFRPMRHWTTNFVIDYDGAGDGGSPSGRPTTARMRADHLLVRQGPEAVELLLLAVYRDRLRREHGRWLFRERVVTPAAVAQPPASA